MEYIKFRGKKISVWLDAFDARLSGLESTGGFLAMSFNSFDEIDLEKEIGGQDDNIKALVKLSGDYSQTVFCGVSTVYEDVRRLSVVIAHRGKLIDIVDSTQGNTGGYKTSDSIKIINSGGVKTALIVDSDIIYPKVWQSISSQADLVLSIGKTLSSQDVETAAELSRLYEIPLILITKSDCFSISPKTGQQILN